MDYIEQTGIWLENRRPLAEAYTSSLKKMDETADTLRGDMVHLGQLREKLALDLEGIRLNQGIEELTRLRKTETQLASMSQSLSQMSDAEAPVLPPSTRADRIDIDAIVK
jgi:hypothetical protein